ncbi:response regulator transcription factor [Solibacillus sp. FSL R7-0668]|uniref:response regulator transcription factor n=1 Tax=Solibacillus sp. FSL R7-0668 TaxID=2921688 RepID=UPI0030F9CEC9
MLKVQRMQGNIELEPVFALKKPIFLKEPAPYVQQVAIDLFELSSVIFIPIEYEQQLYGWISFDQMGETFECDNEKLFLLEQAGKRLGMYLARKQLRNQLNHRIQLSEKEYTILYLLAEGYKNKEIASVLFLSEYTVRDYVQRLMDKLQANNRTQIISTAFRMGLVE